MKRKIFFGIAIFVFVIVLSLLPFGAETVDGSALLNDGQPVLVGDANLDGVVNSDDAVIVLRYLAGYEVEAPVGSPFYVDVEVMPVMIQLKGESSLLIGDSLAIETVILPANTTNKGIIWESSDPNIATVDENGVITGISAGSVTITATSVADENVCISRRYSVLNYPETITIESSSLYSGSFMVGMEPEFKAVFTPSFSYSDIEWSSSDESIITIEWIGDTYCVVRAVGEGTAVLIARSTIDESIYAEYPITVSNNVLPNSITLSESSVSVSVGGSTTLTATFTPANTTNKTVTWTSSDTAVATVVNGKITGVGAGTATITAKSTVDNKILATCFVSVVSVPVPAPAPTSITLNLSECTVVEAYSSVHLTATVYPVTASTNIIWTSSDDTVASILHNSIYGHKPGTAIITATSAIDSSVFATCKVTVREQIYPTSVTLGLNDITMLVGNTFKNSPVISPSNIDNMGLIWTSSDNSIVQVTSSGLMTAMGAGEATVSVICSADNSIYDSCTVTVFENDTTPIINDNKIIMVSGSECILDSTYCDYNMVSSLSSEALEAGFTLTPISDDMDNITGIKIVSPNIEGEYISAVTINYIIGSDNETEVYSITTKKIDNISSVSKESIILGETAYLRVDSQYYTVSGVTPHWYINQDLSTGTATLSSQTGTSVNLKATGAGKVYVYCEYADYRDVYVVTIESATANASDFELGTAFNTVKAGDVFSITFKSNTAVTGTVYWDSNSSKFDFRDTTLMSGETTVTNTFVFDGTIAQKMAYTITAEFVPNDGSKSVTKTITIYVEPAGTETDTFDYAISSAFNTVKAGETFTVTFKSNSAVTGTVYWDANSSKFDFREYSLMANENAVTNAFVFDGTIAQKTAYTITAEFIPNDGSKSVTKTITIYIEP